MPKKKPDDDALDDYKKKRSADATTEPFAQGSEKPRLYVIHKHAATRLHYDLRLEWGGTLRSWAVPKPPSLDPNIKRLAVRVEDHPIEYADFEGVIPKGEYGAGPVIVWDRGTWTNLEEDPEQAHADGKIGFELHGYKLRGRWALVRTKGSEKDWLLIKKPDEYASKEGTYNLGGESILSGLTINEVREGATHWSEIEAELKALGAKKRKVKHKGLKVMLAETAEHKFSKKGWIYELKYDGFRMVAVRDEDGEPHLYYRSGNESTDSFPDLTRALKALPYEGLIMDGEVCVLDEQGRPWFQNLQKRVQLQRRVDIDKATVEYPATLFLFDLLAVGGYDLRPLPLIERKRILQMVLPPTGPLHYADHIETQGEEMFEQVSKLGLEGIMAKDAASRYRGGRSRKWLKFKTEDTDDFVIVGYKKPRGTRTNFGSVHLAAWDDEGDLVYVGRAGSGFSEEQLEKYFPLLEETKIKKPPCVPPKLGADMPRGPENAWCTPKYVAEIRYKQMTPDGVLREPVFLRWRTDKPLEDCMLPPPTYDRTEEPAIPVRVNPGEKAHKNVRLSNLDKVFWPDTGYTKGDLLAYYDLVAPWLMPYLRDRPVVLTRYPDGIAGKNFYQKNAPGFVPGWVRTQRMWSEHSQREIDYFVADDEETLRYMVNLGTIPLHIWMSRTSSLQQPDWSLIDLDPKGAPFSDVVKVARAVKKLCDEIELPCYVKTSGSTGLHILLPLARQFNYQQSRTLAHLISQIIVQQHDDIATLKRVISQREGKVYLDFLQNRHGQLMVSPFSVRARPGAPVSAPLRWFEVNGKLDISKFTIKTMPARLKKVKDDPMLPVLDGKPNLLAALAKLDAKLDEHGKYVG